MANYQTLYFDLSAAQTSTPWFRLLGVNAKNTRAIHGNVTTGDSVQILFTNEVLNSEKQIMQTDAVTSSYAASPAQTSQTFELGYDGNYKWVKVLKTGTNGVARVVVEA